MDFLQSLLDSQKPKWSITAVPSPPVGVGVGSIITGLSIIGSTITVGSVVESSLVGSYSSP